MNLSGMLHELRSHGWTVAVHNDYRLNGEAFTFWLFTNEQLGVFFKGEGRTDDDAVENVRVQVSKLGKSCTHEKIYFPNGTCFVCMSMNVAKAIERERCAKVVEDFAKAYPVGIFIPPPEGKHGATVDACSARALRETLPGVADKIREGNEP